MPRYCVLRVFARAVIGDYHYGGFVFRILHFTDVRFCIGVIAGILVFVPYVGFMIGLLLATISGLGHFGVWSDFAILWLAMGVGTILESMLITPYFVGERVGLHPVAVLAAVVIFGALFGFVGVLISLPLAAVLLVIFRHLRHRYISSDLAYTLRRRMTLLGGFAQVSGLTFLSRVFGLARDIVVAAVFGAGPVADAFFAAFRLPNTLRRFTAEGALTQA